MSSHIERLFRRKRDADLRQWFIGQVGDNGNAIGIIREALEYYRSHLTELENLQVLCAWRDGNTNSEQAAEFIGVAVEEIPDLWQEAVKVGKKKI